MIVKAIAHRARRSLLEQLEPRRLMAAQISYTNFSTTTGLALNGYGSSSTTSSNALVLTDAANQARSALYTTKVPIDTFTTHFSYQSDSSPTAADGFTFVIDNGATTDLGTGGFELGYGGGTFATQSVDSAFNLYNAGTYGSTFDFHNGPSDDFAAPTYGTGQNTAPLNLHSGDVINVTLSYDGTNLTVAATDATTHDTYTGNETVDLASVLGTHSAYVGFTAATGVDFATQSITNWDFTGALTNPPTAPTITAVGPTSTTPVSGKTSDLSATVDANGVAGGITYAWSVAKAPPGAKAVVYSANNSTSANTTTASFSKDGTYRMRLTATDGNGNSTSQDFYVTVAQTPTQVKIQPHKATVFSGGQLQFTGGVYDQFGHQLRTQPALDWEVQTGSGSIDSDGLYTAGAEGHLVISLAGDNLSGTSGETVLT